MTCGFCGKGEICDLEKHNPRQLRDLLIDAGILSESDDDWNDWLTTPIGKKEPVKQGFIILTTYTPQEIWHMNFHVAALYVRSIL